MNMLKKIYAKEAFNPGWLLGIWVNPAFIVRRRLLTGVRDISCKFIGGKLLDIGCGSKPYEHLFKVNNYIGIDVEVSGHNHNSSKVDKFFDGRSIPYGDDEFDWIFTSEVFEHVFNLEDLLSEITRVLTPGGKLAITCPFIWEEHEQPYDFARYTSFGLHDIITKHGFKVESSVKSSNYFETVMQILAMYMYHHCLPKNRYLMSILMPIIVSPFNIIGTLLGKALPNNNNFYLTNILIVVKK